jgi:hypothetical protein
LPAPDANLMSQLAKANFLSKGIKVPSSWDTSLEDSHNRKVGDFQPGVPRPTNIFIPPSLDAIAVDACNKVSEGFEGFIDDACAAICGSWSSWQSAVKFVGVIINAGVGILPPGGMVGGGMMAGPMILARMKKSGGNYALYANAVASAIGQAWTAWEAGYANPALPFPGGTACSTTMPPSPNTPLPLASGVSPGDALMDASLLKASMLGLLGVPGEHADPLFDSLAQAFAQLFLTWKGTTMISNVMGAGGVAPPPPAPPGPVAGAVGNGGSLA